MFDPDIYPINPACMNAIICDKQQAHQHPLEIRDSKNC